MNLNGPLDIQRGLEDNKPNTAPRRTDRRRWTGRLPVLGLVLLLVTTLAFGAWSHYEQHRQVIATAGAKPRSRPGGPRGIGTARRQRPNRQSARHHLGVRGRKRNLFARASGYIAKREVDIGDRVKAGQLLAEIVAPELDHQITQAEATLGQLKAALQHAQANSELAKVTWDRDSPLVSKVWVTAQQGTVDVQNLKAQQAAVAVAVANVVAEEAQLQVLHQLKMYQRAVPTVDKRDAASHQ